jgi:hypothetical protein
MTIRRRHLVAAGIAVLACAAAHAQPLRIDGISPLAPLAAADVTPVVVAHRLEIRLQDERLLSVAPWPAFLPQRFAAQTIEASRKMHPAGPADRVTFIHSPARQPWLAVGNGARQGTVLIGAWHLQHAGNGWAISDGSRSKSWTRAAPVRMAVGGNHWCLYLLDAGMPRRQAGVATEGEAQIAWAAQRLGAQQRSCPTQR